MTDKYRVHELAKDLGTQSKDVLEVLNQHVPNTERKYQTALSEKELNLVLDHFTKQQQVEDVNQYFAAKNKPEASKPSSAKPEAKAAQNQAGEKPAAATSQAGQKPATSGERPQSSAPDRRPYNNNNNTEGGERRPYNNDRRPYNNNNNTEGGERRPYNNDRRPYNNNNNTEGGERRPYNNNNSTEGGERRPYNNDRRPYNNNNNTEGGERRPYNNNNSTEGGERRPYNNDRRPYNNNNNTEGGERKPYNNDRRPYNNNSTEGGERRPYNNNNNAGGERRPYNNNNNAGGERRPYNSNNAGGERRPYNNNNSTGGERRPYNNDRRPYNNDRVFDKDKDSNQRVYNTVKSTPRPPRPAAPAVPREPLPPGTAKGGARHVDMRSSNVDLEKYNEKYEKIATETAKPIKDTAPKKQKFNQRSHRKPVLSRKEQEAEKMRRLEMERQRRQKLEITLPEEISVGDLALKLKVQGTEIVKRLMTMGVMASVSQIIDYDTAALVAIEIGAKVEREVVITIEDRLFTTDEDDNDNLQPRCPVVVVMGHVDHGKTSLLDAIRRTEVTAGEAGGITQHIGAYQVVVNGQPITFLDTPGHAAFTSMRARGAQVTDIAVLVVAADDGIMPQTVEAINHAKAAGVSIIVAINKVDKPTANVEKIKQELTEHGLVTEEWGGETICVPISAKTKFGIDDLLENILLVAEVQELKANPDRLAKGTVIEAKLDKGRGPVATVLVQNGTLRTGDIVIAGTSVGRVRVMLDDKGNRIDEAGPSTPVELTGLSEVPTAGDVLNAVEDERLAKELVDQRRQEAKEEQFQAYQKVTLDNLFSQISQGDIKELPVIVKADVNGSVEAVKQSLEKLSNAEVRVRVIHGAVGAVSESDVMLANASNAIIVGFNVRPEPLARESAERDDVEIRLYRIIYDAINEIESAMKGMLAPKFRDVDLGRAEVRAVYKITNAGIVAGCYVLDGKITRSANIRVVRDGIIVADDKLDSLKRFKDDVKEVATGYECGMSLLKFKDIKEGDIFEAYIVEEYRD